MSLDISPTRDEFRDLAKRGNLIPLIVDLVADVETPVSAFAKVDPAGRGSGPCFLFESAERNEEVGRFSFIGFDPIILFNSAECKGDPLEELRETLSRFKFVQPTDISH